MSNKEIKDEGAIHLAPSSFQQDRFKFYDQLLSEEILKLPLLEAQRRSVAHMAALRYALCFDDMGMGKTAQAIAMGNLHNASKILILCPNIVKESWAEQILKFTDTRLNEVYIGRGHEMNFRHANLKNRFKYFIFNYEALRTSSKGGVVPDIFEGPLDMVITDEAHNIKNPYTQNFMALFKSIMRYPPKLLLMMTGTPFDRCIIEFWTYFTMMGLNPALKGLRTFREAFPNPEHFGLDYCEQGGESVEQIDGGTYSITRFRAYRPDTIHNLYSVMGPLVVRRKISDIVELPKLHIHDVYFQDGQVIPHFDEPTTMDEILANFKKALSYASKRSFGEGDVKKAKANSNEDMLMAIAQKFRMMIAKAKVPSVLESLEKLDLQVVVFSEFITPLNLIAKGLYERDITSSIVTGQMKSYDREHNLELWKKGKAQFLLATFGVLAEGANLQEGQVVAFNDIPWQPSRILQAQRRVWRIGQTEECYNLRFLCKADNFVLDVLNTKNKMIAIMDSYMQNLKMKWRL